MWKHTCQRAPPSLNVSHRFRFWGQWAGTHVLANLLINSVYNLRRSKDVIINNWRNKYSGSFFLPINFSWRWFCCSLVTLAVAAHEPAPLHLLQTWGWSGRPSHHSSSEQEKNHRQLQSMTVRYVLLWGRQERGQLVAETLKFKNRSEGILRFKRIEKEKKKKSLNAKKIWNNQS